MTEKIFKPIILSQLEDALEEREGADRRKQKAAVPPQGVADDRRKNDRRDSKKS